MPRLPEALGFPCGALTAMLVVIAVSCGVFTKVLPERDRPVRAFGAVHYMSVLGSVTSGWAASLSLHGPLRFFVALFHQHRGFEIRLCSSCTLRLACTPTKRSRPARYSR